MKGEFTTFGADETASSRCEHGESREMLLSRKDAIPSWSWKETALLTTECWFVEFVKRLGPERKLKEGQAFGLGFRPGIVTAVSSSSSSLRTGNKLLSKNTTGWTSFMLLCLNLLKRWNGVRNLHEMKLSFIGPRNGSNPSFIWRGMNGGAKRFLERGKLKTVLGDGELLLLVMTPGFRMEINPCDALKLTKPCRMAHLVCHLLRVVSRKGNGSISVR
nr:hypothetical protein Iba_chr10cCG11450 [Ipomoea batatas]